MANDYYPQFDFLFVCNYVHVRLGKLVLFLFPSTVAREERVIKASHSKVNEQVVSLSKCK